MSTPLTDRINLLTSQANAATGASDTTLSDAIETLIAGYGQGGGAIKTDSGTLYIDESTTSIVVNHNLEGVPDFAYICIDVSEGSLIPMGCCVCEAYGIIIPKSLQNMADNTRMVYVYYYRHPTSGNILGSYYTLNSRNYSDEIFTFIRGSQPWLPTDTNGDPIPYKWMVGRFTE